MRKQVALISIAVLIIISSVVCTLTIPNNRVGIPDSTIEELKATLDAVQSFQANQEGTLQAVQAAQEALQATLAAPTPAPPAEEPPGAISGQLSYPSEMIPPMRVVATNLNTGEVFFVDTAENQPTYLIENLPVGVYSVVAYTNGLPGGYSLAVPCGLTVDCTDHSLIEVAVNPGQETSDVNPGDWYAPEGTFPPNPTQ